MSDVTKKDLRELAEKATRGPWWIDSHGHRMSTEDGMVTVFIADDRIGKATRHPETGNLSHWPNDWDASFIASANPKTIIGLLDEIEALEAENARLRAGHEPVASISWTNDDPEWKLKMLAEPVHPPVVPLKLYTTPQPSAVPDIAGWLWHWLMDYCKKKGQPPATRNDLFAVVSDLRKMLASPSAPATAQGVNQQLLEALENTAAWIEQLPVPTAGAAGQLVKIDKAIAAVRKGEGE